MRTLPEYPWFDQAPGHLKTRNQLAKQGLRLVSRMRAYVVWRGVTPGPKRNQHVQCADEADWATAGAERCSAHELYYQLDRGG